MSDEGLDGKDNIELQENSQKMILDWFRRLAKEHGDLQIVYRPHPAEANNETLLQCEKEVPSFHVVAKESIRNWILNSDILLNWKSTSMIEAYASGKKTLVLHPTKIPFKLTMPFFEEGHYKAVTSYEELEAGLMAEDNEFPIEKDPEDPEDNDSETEPAEPVEPTTTDTPTEPAGKTDAELAAECAADVPLENIETICETLEEVRFYRG